MELRGTMAFGSEAAAREYASSLPKAAEAVVVEVKNVEDTRLGYTTAQCRTLWWNVHYNTRYAK